MTTPPPAPGRQESVHGLFAMATATASQAIARWTNGTVTLELEELHEVPLEEAITQLGISEQRVAMILLGIDGDFSGDFVLTFEEDDGHLLCSAVTGLDSPSNGEWSELDKSALLETGNILGSAYLNELTERLMRQLVPSPPQFVLDYGCSVIEQVLLPHGMYSDTVFVARTKFRHGPDGWLNAQVLFVPAPDLRQAMEGSTTCTSNS